MLIQPETLHEMVFAVDLFIKLGPNDWPKLTTQQKMSRMEDMLDEHYGPGNGREPPHAPRSKLGGAKAAPSRSHPRQGCGT